MNNMMDRIWAWRRGVPENQPNQVAQRELISYPQINGEPDYLYGIEAVQSMSPWYEYQLSADFQQERTSARPGRLGATFERKLMFPVQYPRRSDGSATAPPSDYAIGSSPFLPADF